MLIVVPILAPLRYVFATLVEEARRVSVRDAFEEGSISREEPRQRVGNIADTW
jgi:hypothetical protein